MQDTRNDVLESVLKVLEGEAYQHASGVLRKDVHRYSCLGVICEIVGVPLGGYWELTESYLSSRPVYSFIYWGLERTLVLPPQVQAYLGLRSDQGHFNWNELPGKMRLRIGRRLGYMPKNPVSLIQLNDAAEDFSLVTMILRYRPKSLFKGGLQ